MAQAKRNEPSPTPEPQPAELRTVPGRIPNVLLCRQPDSPVERKKPTAKEAHEDRLRLMAERNRFDGMPDGAAGGAELRKRLRAYFDTDKRANPDGYRTVRDGVTLPGIIVRDDE